MRSYEFLTELGDKPSPYDPISANEFASRAAPGLLLIVEFNSTFTTLEIAFSVNGKYNITGTRNEIKIFSTVKSIIQNELLKQLTPQYERLCFTASNKMSSRIKLYMRRAVPIISEILGNEWEYKPIPISIDDDYLFVWNKK